MISRVCRRSSCYLGCRVFRKATFHKNTRLNHSHEVADENEGGRRGGKHITIIQNNINETILQNSNTNDISPRELEDVNSVQEFEKYVQDPARTVGELLSIDVRTLPPLVRLTCLEAVLSAARKDQLRAGKSGRHVPNEHSRSAVTSEDNWPSKYLAVEHASRWFDWDIGIDPGLDLSPSAPKPAWFKSPQFELLVLTTAASANRLPLPQLLNLAGHLRFLWTHFDPVVYASVLRLLTSQINELSLIDVFRIVSMIKELPSARYSIPTAQVPADPSRFPDSLSTLANEADLLRSAARMHILSKQSGMESMDVVVLLRMLRDLNPILIGGERVKILRAVDISMIINPQQKNLYTLIFIFTQLSLLETYTNNILHRCFGQLQRKLHLAHRFPGNDQTRYLCSVILALANLNVGAPQHSQQSQQPVSHMDPDCLSAFTRPPVMPIPPVNPAEQLHRGLDLGGMLNVEWIHQMFTDLSGYIATTMTTPAATTPSAKSAVLNTRRSVQLQAEVAYALALLGYRANIILDRPRDQSYDSLDPPLFKLSELLVDPNLPSSANEINVDVVRRLPRVDWQLYYNLAFEILSSSRPEETESRLPLSYYVALKKHWVNTFVEHLRSRLRPTNPLKMATFHRISCPDKSEHSYFADIIFELQSRRSPDKTKIVLCFVCCGRDHVIQRPLDTLISTYRNAAPEIPCITFTYTPWSLMDTLGRRERCDSFLKELAELMIRSPGLPTDGFRMWTDITSE